MYWSVFNKKCMDTTHGNCPLPVCSYFFLQIREARRNINSVENEKGTCIINYPMSDVIYNYEPFRTNMKKTELTYLYVGLS